MRGRLSQRRRYCQEGSAHLCGRFRGSAVALAAPDETESARDPQRVRDRYRPRRRPAGRRTRGHGTADPAGRPGGRVPPPGARRARPALRTAARPLPARPGPRDRLRHGLRRGLRAPGRARHRRAGVHPGGPLPPGGPRLRRGAGAGHRLRGHAVPGRAVPERPPRQRVRRLGDPGRGRPQADRRVGARGDPQRLPRLRHPRLRRAGDGGQPGRARGPRRDRRPARQPASRALLRAARRARAVRAHGVPDRPHPGREGGARRRLRARPGRPGLRLRRRDAAQLPRRADPGLPGGDPGRPGRPGGGRAGGAQRRHPADSRGAAHPGRGARRARPHPRRPAGARHAGAVGAEHQLPHRRAAVLPGGQAERGHPRARRSGRSACSSGTPTPPSSPARCPRPAATGSPR